MTCEKSEFLKADGTRRVVITGMGAISPAGIRMPSSTQVTIIPCIPAVAYRLL